MAYPFEFELSKMQRFYVEESNSPPPRHFLLFRSRQEKMPLDNWPPRIRTQFLYSRELLQKSFWSTGVKCSGMAEELSIRDEMAIAIYFWGEETVATADGATEEDGKEMKLETTGRKGESLELFYSRNDAIENNIWTRR